MCSLYLGNSLQQNFPFVPNCKFNGNQYSKINIQPTTMYKQFYFQGTPIINAERITDKEHYTK